MSVPAQDIPLLAGVLRVQALADGIFRVRLRADGQFPEPALVRYGVLRGAWPAVETLVSDEAQSVTLVTASASLQINKADGRLILRDGTGEMLTTAAPPAAAPGFAVEFALREDERLYGLGDDCRDRIERRGQRNMVFVQSCLSNAPIPFLMSTRGWGVLLNTTWRHAIDAGKEQPDCLRCWAPRGELDYYLIAGADLPALLDRGTEISGKPALLPLWAYGLTYVCNTRADARELLDTCLSFRREGIPCDLIGLEPGWMAHNYDTSAETDWHPERFHLPYWQKEGKHPGTFLGAVERLGFKLSLWLCCEWDVSHYEERLAGGHLGEAWYTEFRRGEDGVYDDPHMHPTLMDQVTKPDEPWFEHLQKFVDQGVSAFKMDGCGIVNLHPDRAWGNGMDDEEFHNLYPLLANKQMALGFREQTGRRPMVYTSAAYTGIQQYAATWAGDTGGGADVLVSMLNLGLCGHANTSCDMDVYSREGMHFGFLQPWSQINGWITWDQPWYLGEKLEPVFRFYARLRYRLLPYLYSLAHLAARTGLPILRAMPLAFPDDPACANLLRQYMLGDALLVAAFTDRVRLPAGRWIDYWSGTQYDGPCDLACAVPADRGGPLFVRAGAIIPQWPEMDYVGQRPLDRLILHVYPHGKSAFTLYEDDGVSLAYLDGEVAVTEIRATVNAGEITVSIGPRVGKYQDMPERRTIELWLFIDRPTAVWIDGAPFTDWQYREKERALCLELASEAAEVRVVTV